jgi:hypothetical protein
MGPVKERQCDQNKEIDFDEPVTVERAVITYPAKRNCKAKNDDVDWDKKSGHHAAGREEAPPKGLRCFFSCHVQSFSVRNRPSITIEITTKAATFKATKTLRGISRSPTRSGKTMAEDENHVMLWYRANRKTMTLKMIQPGELSFWTKAVYASGPRVS